MAGWNSSEAFHRASANRSAASEWTPCRAAFVWYAAGPHSARASYRRIAAWSRTPLSGGSFPGPGGSSPAWEGCRHPTTRASDSCAVWRCSTTFSTAAAGIDP